jgi:hypothetical protein
MSHSKRTSYSGFALLITLVIISVVISIGVTLIDLTIKQLRLANSSKDSETAFHAANAGVECIRYWRNSASSQFETGLAVAVTCFNVAATSSVPLSLGTAGVYRHDLEITWGPNTDRCSRIRMITLSSEPDSAGVSYSGIPAVIAGYPDASKTCVAGGRCSIISVQGYNRPCNLTSELGSIQREVLLDL